MFFDGLWYDIGKVRKGIKKERMMIESVRKCWITGILLTILLWEMTMASEPCAVVQVQAADIEKQWYLQEIDRVEVLHGEEDSTSPVVVAVIDTGVQTDHPALADSLWVNEAERDGEIGVDDDGNGYVDDVYGYNVRSKSGDVTDTDGHGTHIAGIIAMHSTKNSLCEGVNPKVKLMIIKAGNSSNGFTSNNLINALEYARTNGADVINMSLGTTYCTDALRDAIDLTAEKAVVVAAAGNSGVPTAESGYKASENVFPAGLESVIGVMSFGMDGKLSQFSNWDYQTGTSVDYEVAAPGEDIFSTTLSGKYKKESGTSMSTAIVSAVCARVVQEWQEKENNSVTYSTELVRQCIINGTKRELIYTDEDGNVHSFPKVSMLGALDYLEQTVNQGKQPEPECTPSVSALPATPIPTPTLTPIPIPTPTPTLTLTLTPAPTEKTFQTDIPAPNSTLVPEKSAVPAIGTPSAPIFTKTPAGAVLRDKSGNRYKVIKNGKTVCFVKAKSKKNKSFVISDTVTIKGCKYKVIHIANKAFFNNRRLVRITIGKNVKKIGKHAFDGCERLRIIRLKTKWIKKSQIKR